MSTRYFLRSTHQPETHDPGAADPAMVLALVAAAIPLPIATTKALRLVCRATRLGMDQSVLKINLTPAIAEVMNDDGSPLTTGLTELSCSKGSNAFCSILSFTKTCKLASINGNTLEKLHLELVLPRSDASAARAALRCFRGCEWPRLRFLTLHSVSETFISMINIDSMPKLAYLRLDGTLGHRDIAALAAGRHLPSTIEYLDLNFVDPPSWTETDQDHASLTTLLQATSKLRVLKLTVGGGYRDLAFLAFPGLSGLETLLLNNVKHSNLLKPFAAAPKPRLQMLHLHGITADSADLSAIITNAPALKCMYLNFQCIDVEFLGDIRCEKLRKLHISNFTATQANAASVGAALSLLPALKALILDPAEGPDADRLMQPFLSSLPARHKLRRLGTGGAWRDNEGSMYALTRHRKKLPRLQELEMLEGRCTPASFVRLAAAGERGAWPRLRLVRINSLNRWLDEDSEEEQWDDEAEAEGCQEVMRDVWPDIVVDIMNSII